MFAFHITAVVKELRRSLNQQLEYMQGNQSYMTALNCVLCFLFIKFTFFIALKKNTLFYPSVSFLNCEGE